MNVLMVVVCSIIFVPIQQQFCTIRQFLTTSMVTTVPTPL